MTEATSPQAPLDPEASAAPAPDLDALAVPIPADLPAPAAALAAVPILAHVDAIRVFAPEKGAVWTRRLVFLAAFGLYLFNAGSFGLWDPWETHYGEVSRTMYESYDWVNPWWGYREQIGTEPIAGSYFYSKPIYIFWAEASMMKLIGFGDWAIRLPVALLGALMVFMAFLTFERLHSLRMGLLAAAVTGLSPFVYMLARQAQTDMPFVATMSIAIFLLMLAIFGPSEQVAPKIFMRRVWLFVAFYVLNLGPQLGIIATDLRDDAAGAGLEAIAKWSAIVQQNGVWHLIFYVPPALWVLWSVLRPVFKARKTPEGLTPELQDRTTRTLFLMCFYLVAAQSTYAKGLLGFMLPGAIVLAYFAISTDWKILAKMELLRGSVLFIVASFPWYVAMFCRHGRAFYERFFIHDHFNRLGAGVHQIDSGTFEHFIKWMGFGLFPWTIFVPFALIAFARFGFRPDNAADRVRGFVFTWFLVAFAVFTISATKFHHYIFPAVPALTLLVAYFLEDAFADRGRFTRAGVVIGLGFLVTLSMNLLGDFQNLRNLFTYKYDRPMPEHMPWDMSAQIVWPQDRDPILTWDESTFGQHVGPVVKVLLDMPIFRYKTFLIGVTILAGLFAFAMIWRRLRKLGVIGFAGTSALMAFWALNWYMPALAPHWAQRYLFDAYYEQCTLRDNPPEITEAYTPLLARAGLGFIPKFLDSQPKRVCTEDIISWLITWRGETYYSYNEIQPINKEQGQFEPYMEERNRGNPLFVLLERGRYKGFESKLKTVSLKLRTKNARGFANINDWKCDLAHNDSAYFNLALCKPSFGPLPDKKGRKDTPPAPPPPPMSDRPPMPAGEGR